MIRSIIFSVVLVSFLLPKILFSQDVVLRTQADVNAFDPAITIINGNLLVGYGTFPSNNDITNLSNLLNLTSISGFLIIYNNPKLTNVDGFSNLTSIGSGLQIINNDVLTNLNGFSKLNYLGWKLEIKHNLSLINVDGFSSLSAINGPLSIESNFALTNVDGFSRLSIVKSFLYIGFNTSLTNVNGFNALTSIAGYLQIDSNELLSNLDGFSNIKEIGKNLQLRLNKNLTNVDGFSNLSSIGGNLDIGTNQNLTNVNGFSSLISVSGYLEILTNRLLTDVDGFSNLTSISGYLNISNNSALTNVDGFSNLTSISGYLNISSNYELTNVDGFSNLTVLLDDLRILSNYNLIDVDGFSNLTSIEGNIEVYSNEILTNIDGFSGLNSVGGDIIVSSNPKLTNVNGFSSLTSIPGILSINYSEGLQNVDGFAKLAFIGGKLFFCSNFKITNIDGFSNLKHVGGNLDLYNNFNLKSLNGFYNLKFIGGNLSIYNNSVLTNCCGIQDILSTPLAIKGSVTIYDNPSSCNSGQEILNSKCLNYVYAEGKTYIDIANDGCDSLDVLYPNLKFQFVQDSNIFYKISSFDGNYKFQLKNDNFFIIIPSLNDSLFKIEPDTLIISLSSDGFNLVNDFCITPVKEFNDLEVTIIPLIAAVPGFDTRYEINYKNKGTTTMSGKVELYFEEDLVSYVSSEPVEDSIIENIIVWNFNDLLPFEQRKIIFTMKLNTPTDDPPLNNSDVLGYTASIYPVQEDATPDDNIFKLNQTVVNSFDPNDKTCLEGNVFDIENIGGYMNYLIRFENQGTADAVNIKVVDIIDTTLFDISTLNITSSSHICITNIYMDTVEFVFDYIFLPFDLDFNDGYVAFKVKTWPSLTLSTILKNEASIYFDYNYPIYTSKVLTKVVSDTDHDGYINLEDCDDTNPNINPGLPEIPYDGLNNDCDPLTLDDDLDQDGYNIAEDCNDIISTINPGQIEICYNKLDDDCNINTPDDDIDQDGFLLADDCDDTNPYINPIAIEIPDNGIDEDCNGEDETTGLLNFVNIFPIVYPNPASTILYFILPEGLDFKVEIYSFEGKLIKIYYNEPKIDVEYLSEGRYICKIVGINKNETLIQKVEIVR